jgi:hypothetical protein
VFDRHLEERRGAAAALLFAARAEVVMAKRSDALLLWAPRILGILVSLFLSLFALDAFGPGKSFLEAGRDYLIHVSPMLVLLGVVALSWRWEWVGGLVFTGLAVTYAYVARLHLAWGRASRDRCSLWACSSYSAGVNIAGCTARPDGSATEGTLGGRTRG